MRKSRFTEEQIVGILKEGEACVPVADLLRRHGISRATYFLWRSKYSGTTVPELRRLKELEAENTKLKRLYAELALENAAIKDILVGAKGDPPFEAPSCPSCSTTSRWT
jgi:putative transposase